MDGAGTLLGPQLNHLHRWFDLRCLAIAPDDVTGWRSLAHKVCQLISEAISPQQSRRRWVYLCGESFGGCLAMQVLTEAPYLFGRLILVNPASSFKRLPWMQLSSYFTRTMPSLLYEYGSRGLVPFLIESHRVAPGDRRALQSAMAAVPAKTAAWRMNLLSRFEVERLPLERMTHPVLLVAGGSDRLLPSHREAKSLQARFPNAQLTILPDSGHACLLESSTNLEAIMRQHDFLDL